MDIDKLIRSLEKEIVATTVGIEQTESLERLKQVAVRYNGEDKIISFSDIKKQISEQKDEEVIMSGFKGLDDLLKGFRPQQLVVVSALTKSGKCVKEDTKILMSDGSIKIAKEVEIGDKLMGPDSFPRKVLALGDGYSEMYEVNVGGEIFIANGDHILPLRNSKGDYVELSIDDYLKKNKQFKKLYKGFFCEGLSFKSKKIILDPYFLGIWLGDGSSAEPAVTNKDKEIINYLYDFAKNNKGEVTTREKRPSFCETYYLKDMNLKNTLKTLGVLNNKHIPKNYLLNSKENRLQLLAGLIDTDGHLTKNKYPYYEMIMKDNQLSSDIVFLARSLGFRVTSKDKIVKLAIWDKGRNYKRISIRGDLSSIPLKVQYKKTKFKPTRDFLASHLKIKSIGKGKYCGFELDGDGLFVLGNFVVTHNTTFLMDMTTKLKEYCPLWFPFEESTEELVRKFIERGEEPPEAYAPQNMKGNAIEWIESKIIEAIAKHDSKVVFIDQLDFIVPMSGDNHHLMIGKTMRDLKGLAKKWNIVIFIICHLAKAKMDTQPTLEDLKGSSSIGQEADTVILLWRETKRENGQVVITDNVNVSVQANRRFGKTGNVKMVYREGHFIEEEWESDNAIALNNYNKF